MKVKELIGQLTKHDQDATVWIPHGIVYYDFTFIGCDDTGDVELGVASGDRPA